MDMEMLQVTRQRSFWWVNHKQPYRYEVGGGYIWSPTAKKNGAYNQTYENLKLVQKGDIVFSYAEGLIKAIGTAISGYQDAPKPVEFGTAGDDWDASGWRVPINWVTLDEPLRPKSHLVAIAPLLPDKHSPIRAVNGDGVQSCYLARVSNELGNVLLRLAGQFDTESDEVEIEAQEKEQVRLVWESNISQTDKEQIVKARVAKGFLKIDLLGLSLVVGLRGFQT